MAKTTVVGSETPITLEFPRNTLSIFEVCIDSFTVEVTAITGGSTCGNGTPSCDGIIIKNLADNVPEFASFELTSSTLNGASVATFSNDALTMNFAALDGAMAEGSKVTLTYSLLPVPASMPLLAFACGLFAFCHRCTRPT